MPRALPMLLPLLTLALGSWVGVGTPYGDETRRAFAGAVDFAHAGSPPPPPPIPQAVGSEPPLSIDPSLLPNPTPWPELNPAETLGKAWLLAEGPAPTKGDGRRLVTFTFDDGPFPETTPVVLHVLARHHVHATFFWIGRYLDGDSARAVATREVARQVVLAGHLVGNHTHDHERLPALARAQQIAQIDDGAASIERVTGKRPILFRPPYGQLDDSSEELLRTRGQTLVLWSVEAEDMKRDDPDAMVANLTDQIEYGGGGIVLLHDIRFTSADALDKVMTWLDARRYDPRRPARMGYQIVDLPDYLRAVASSPQPYGSREELEKARAAAWRKAHPNAGVPAVMISEEPLM